MKKKGAAGLTRHFNAGYFDAYWKRPAAPPADPKEAAAYAKGYRLAVYDRFG